MEMIDNLSIEMITIQFTNHNKIGRLDFNLLNFCSYKNLILNMRVDNF